MTQHQELEELLKKMDDIGDEVADIIREDLQDEGKGYAKKLFDKFNNIHNEINDLVNKFPFDRLTFYPICCECGEKFKQTFTSDGFSMEKNSCKDCDCSELIGEWE